MQFSVKSVQFCSLKCKCFSVQFVICSLQCAVFDVHGTVYSKKIALLFSSVHNAVP